MKHNKRIISYVDQCQDIKNIDVTFKGGLKTNREATISRDGLVGVGKRLISINTTFFIKTW